MSGRTSVIFAYDVLLSYVGQEYCHGEIAHNDKASSRNLLNTLAGSAAVDGVVLDRTVNAVIKKVTSSSPAAAEQFATWVKSTFNVFKYSKGDTATKLITHELQCAIDQGLPIVTSFRWAYLDKLETLLLDELPTIDILLLDEFTEYVQAVNFLEKSLNRGAAERPTSSTPERLATANSAISDNDSKAGAKVTRNSDRPTDILLEERKKLEGDLLEALWHILPAVIVVMWLEHILHQRDSLENEADTSDSSKEGSITLEDGLGKQVAKILQHIKMPESLPIALQELIVPPATALPDGASSLLPSTEPVPVPAPENQRPLSSRVSAKTQVSSLTLSPSYDVQTALDDAQTETTLAIDDAPSTETDLSFGIPEFPTAPAKSGDEGRNSEVSDDNSDNEDSSDSPGDHGDGSDPSDGGGGTGGNRNSGGDPSGDSPGGVDGDDTSDGTDDHNSGSDRVTGDNPPDGRRGEGSGPPIETPGDDGEIDGGAGDDGTSSDDIGGGTDSDHSPGDDQSDRLPDDTAEGGSGGDRPDKPNGTDGGQDADAEPPQTGSTDAPPGNSVDSDPDTTGDAPGDIQEPDSSGGNQPTPPTNLDSPGFEEPSPAPNESDGETPDLPSGDTTDGALDGDSEHGTDNPGVGSQNPGSSDESEEPPSAPGEPDGEISEPPSGSLDNPPNSGQDTSNPDGGSQEPGGADEPSEQQPNQDSPSAEPPSISADDPNVALPVIDHNTGSLTITDFTGVGTGTDPEANGIELDDIDTLVIDDPALSPETLLMQEVDGNLVLTFVGFPDIEITLEEIKLEEFDTLPGDVTHNNSPVGNIVFEGNSDSFDTVDIFNASYIEPEEELSREELESIIFTNESFFAAPGRNRIFNQDTVTFLNDNNNVVMGFDNSDDVINGQGGDDLLWGKSGDDTLRGGGGDDILFGGEGDDTLTGSVGRDRFVFTPNTGMDTITDFDLDDDKIVLQDGLRLEDLEIQSFGSSTHILVNGEAIARLVNVDTDGFLQKQDTIISSELGL
ncbi:MAG: hypothetical protein AAF289_01355 [Cyanobacteria bacterium P01_A01_bin.135]